MKYMLLMQFSEAAAEFPPIHAWTPEEIQAHIGFMGDVNGKLVASGEFVDGQGLAMPDQAKIVRAGDGGGPVVTEGPFAETKEWLAGYWIVDTDTPERAVELAAYISTAPGPGGRPLNMPIEVRPVMSAPPQEL
ncbi:YciI family protein [Plantactinospora sp. B5E13]|uniref:YciI family protein n=1 Tax=unclassified Plantactinospora TaxID=2631981 RepID=UPI00325EFA8E